MTSRAVLHNVTTEELTRETRVRHAGDDFLAFPLWFTREYPTDDVHVILDNVSTYKMPNVQAWLARHLRFTFHFIPASAS